jgi:hypothetical protein
MASKRLFQWLHNFTARIASMILALGFLDGVVGAWLYGNTPFPNSAIVFMIANAFLAFLWFRLDSDQRSYRRTPFLTIAVVGVSIVAIPYYLFRTRGIRSGAIGVLVLVSLLFGYGVMALVGRLVVRVVRP